METTLVDALREAVEAGMKAAVADLHVRSGFGYVAHNLRIETVPDGTLRVTYSLDRKSVV